MGRIIDRALDIINDHLKDQTSSFSDPVTIKPMARGGEVLEDKYPSHYMPGVGRQVMADGGMPDPVMGALDIARSMPEEPAIAPGSINPKPPVSPFEGRVQSPKLAQTFDAENAPGVIVSPRPGKGSGPRVTPEPGIPYEDRDYVGFGPRGESPTSDIEFSHATPAIAGTALPPPVQHPLQNEPRMQKVVENTHRILKSPGFRKLVEDHVGLRGPLQITHTHGTWLGEPEPSFIISHPDMRQEHADKLAHMLGFGLQQDAVVRADHNPNIQEGTLAALIGHGKRLSANDIDGLTAAAKKEGLDYTITKDGKAAKFLHFGGDEEYPDFLQKVGRIADSNGLKERYNARTEGSLINAQDYLPRIFGAASGVDGVQDGTGRSPDLFGRIIDHILAPYAKAVAGEGYRLSPERLAETFGLTQEEEDKVRNSLYPKSKGDRTTVPLMNGEEELDVRPTGARGNATVNDVLYALQNRSAEKGQIDPGDFSDKAMKTIASDIANEVKYHVDNSDKSAVGWYDAALKKAKAMYHNIFPEIKTDKNKEMLFDAILGITSQGNDVHSNSVFAARVYDKMRNEGKTLPQAVKDLSGGFGAQTNAIEGNLMKLHHLLDQNGFDRMRDLFNQKKTVSEWNKILREDPSLKVPGQELLKMQGAGDQKVTGWMVFGPKIGSFINNLHGDYSTLTADLWFTRTWNRLLGHNFIHAPLAEQKQYQDFKDALKAEFLHHNGLPHEQYAGKTSEGQYVKDKSGDIKPWTFGNDMRDMSHDDFESLINDPEKMRDLAADLYEKYKGGGFKDKSDLRRRSKNWMENRDLPAAAPRGDKEREFQQKTVEEAQKLLKKRHGLNISIADIQAALWFHEKELFGKLGVAPERAQPADYADAAKKTLDLIKSNELYRVKSREKKPAKAYGGAINPVELRNNDLEDEARRLILWSYAAAPYGRNLALSREDGGRTYPVAMTKEADDLGGKHAKLRKMSPQEFLRETDPLHIGKGDRKVIDTFKHNITGGHHLGPLKIYNNGGQDGRHRANAAKELGIKTVPVIDYRKADGGPVDDVQNAVNVARNLTPMGFYSAAAEAASKIPQRAPIDQIINKVKGSPGVKAEELDYSGVRDAFAGQKSVDPKEVARHFQENLPQISEKVYGGKPPGGIKQPRSILNVMKEYDAPFPQLEGYEDVSRVNPVPGKTYWIAKDRDGTHHVYSNDGTYLSEHETMESANQAAHNYAHGIDPVKWESYNGKPLVLPGGDNYREVVMHLPQGVTEPRFPKTNHWPQNDVIAHLRMQDRVDPAGKKALHLEEIQSDWGQLARKNGIRPTEEERKAAYAAWEDARNAQGQAFVANGNRLPDEATQRALNIAEKEAFENAERVTNAFRDPERVPPGPYVTDTNSWTDLALKRALKEAAEGGYDKIVFTPGQEQVKRYNLADQVHSIAYDPEEKTLSYISKHAPAGSGYQDAPGNVEPDKIAKYIGKEAAKRLLETEPHPLSGNHILEGEDLEFGGHGQKEFYDRIIPSRLQGLVKKLDPKAKVNVFSHDLPTPEGDIVKGHEVALTPAMREAVKKGLPAFERGGSILKSAFKILSKYPR